MSQKFSAEMFFTKTRTLIMLQTAHLNSVFQASLLKLG
jgi:hypothetical protein